MQGLWGSWSGWMRPREKHEKFYFTPWPSSTFVGISLREMVSFTPRLLKLCKIIHLFHKYIKDTCCASGSIFSAVVTHSQSLYSGEVKWTKKQNNQVSVCELVDTVRTVIEAQLRWIRMPGEDRQRINVSHCKEAIQANNAFSFFHKKVMVCLCKGIQNKSASITLKKFLSVVYPKKTNPWTRQGLGVLTLGIVENLL